MPEHWKGIFKLIKEMGELSQLLGKAGPFSSRQHPDGKGELQTRIPFEVADVYAALDYFVENNFSQQQRMAIKLIRRDKLERFKVWGLTGVTDDERDD
jgi:hypothetical protein